MIEDKDDRKLPFKDHVVIRNESWNDQTKGINYDNNFDDYFFHLKPDT